jgi:hypothetical protein
MFVKSIEAVDQFTRPIHTISRTYGGIVAPGSSTLFFVNEEGVAITCKHVLQVINNAEVINQKFLSFKAEKVQLAKDDDYQLNLKALETKYGYRDETTVQLKINFLNSVDNANFKYIEHPTIDLAIIMFEGFTRKFYTSHAIFVKSPDKVKQGKSLCRLGYPFPEFNNYRINQASDDIEWTNEGIQNSPKFPLDGIITRFGSDGKQAISIEMSTPGLRGQSGGPLFDSNGLVYGMQHLTSHLHLGFDIADKEMIIDGKKTRISNFPFLHVGHCIHVDRITEFLRQNNIKFYQEQ